MRKAVSAVVFRRNGRAVGYTLLGEGQAPPAADVPGVESEIVSFGEAYRLFEQVRLHYGPDGVPTERDQQE